MNKNKPLVNKERRYRLSKLFNGTKTSYTRIHRDYRNEQKKRGTIEGSLNHSLGIHNQMKKHAQLFDTNNYFGPTTGKFF